MRIHTGFLCFMEIGQIFHNKYVLNKKTFQVEIRKMDCKNASSQENGTGQHPV